MFKIMILQRYYGLGDRQVEYQILDRSSFKSFLGLETGDKVPDEKTVWAFRDKLTGSGLVEDLFGLFNDHLEQKELIFNQGRMIDVSFTVAPRQRNTRGENQKIRDGGGKDLWNDRPHRKSYKDIDAQRTKKNNENFYGYKDHAKVDTKNKFINKYLVTSASVHDSQATEDLLDKEDEGQPLNADSAYTGEKQEAIIAKYKMVNQVHGKGPIIDCSLPFSRFFFDGFNITDVRETFLLQTMITTSKTSRRKTSSGELLKTLWILSVTNNES
jgi:IS5 family transposase